MTDCRRLTPEQRAEFRRWMDRGARPCRNSMPMPDGSLWSCPLPMHPTGPCEFRPADELPRTWRDWFTTDGEYLGERSARMGPDDVKASQPCPCDVCQAAKVGSSSTNGDKVGP